MFDRARSTRVATRSMARPGPDADAVHGHEAAGGLGATGAISPSPRGMSPHHVLSMQRLLGNRAVMQMLRHDATPVGGGALTIQRVIRYAWQQKEESGVAEKTVEEALESLKKSSRYFKKEWDDEGAREVLLQIEKEQESVKEPVKWDDIGRRFKQIMEQRAKSDTPTTIEPEKPKQSVFHTLIDTQGPISIASLKNYLGQSEDSERPDVWKTALRLRDETYGKPQQDVEMPEDIDKVIKAIAKEKSEALSQKLPVNGPQFQLMSRLSEDQKIRFKEYSIQSKMAAKSVRKWEDRDIIPKEIVEEIAKHEAHVLREREKMQMRGLPPEIYDKKEGKHEEGGLVPPKETIVKLLDPMGGENAALIAGILTSKAPTVGVEYLRGQMVRLLADIALLWTKIKPAGQRAIVELVVKKSRDIGDAKGAVGELNGVLFAVTHGEAVNTGGPDKPLPGGDKIGNVNTQDIDIRYVQGGNTRVYMEAKYDAKTLIDKYEGQTAPTAPKTEGMTGEKDELSETPSTIVEKATPVKEKSHQQQRYEAMLTKKIKSKEEAKGGKHIEGRALQAVVANNHDWLLLYIPGGTGKRVSRWLAESKWTVIIGQHPIPPELALALLNTVPLVYRKLQETGEKPEKPEEWAERISGTIAPGEFLKKAESILGDK
jgi:hypothetical protein